MTLTQSSRRRVSVALLLAGATATLLTLAGCCTTGGGGGGGRPRDPNAAKKRQLAELKNEEVKLKKVADAITEGNYAIVSLGGTDIQGAANKALPISMNANKLNAQVSGTLTISELKNVKIVGGKVSFTLVGKGTKINVSSLGRAALGNAKVNKYIEAVQAGLSAKVSGKVSAKKGNLVFTGKISSVSLKKHKSLEKDVKGALNGSFFKTPHTIQMGKLAGPRGSKLAVRDAFVAGTKVAIVFAP